MTLTDPISHRAPSAILMTSVLLFGVAAGTAQNESATTNSTSPIPIGCGTITKSGNYVLTGAGAGESVCLQVTANNVTIHLAGTYIGANGGGIYASSVKNLKIFGPGTFDGEGPGIELINVTSSQVVGVKCVGDGVGIHIHNDTATPAHNRIIANNASAASVGTGILAESQGNVYLGNDVCEGNSNVGIAILGGEADVIEGNRCNSVIDTGFAISGTHEIIIGNVATNGVSSGSVGISISGTGNVIRNNEANGNKGGDLVDNSGACGNNTWTANAFGIANLPCIQ